MVENFLNEQLDSDLFMPFVPLQEKLFKIAGIVKRELKPLFPAYVFIESGLPSQEFIRRTSTSFYVSHMIVGLLKYSDTEIAMRELERRILLSLCNDEHCIESSSGIIEGTRIHITGGPLKGRESIVKKSK